jgi:hypothetical protein
VEELIDGHVLKRVLQIDGLLDWALRLVA